MNGSVEIHPTMQDTIIVTFALPGSTKEKQTSIILHLDLLEQVKTSTEMTISECLMLGQLQPWMEVLFALETAAKGQRK
jgi:hypothetical protein